MRTIFSLFFITYSIFSTEEKNFFPFFQISTKKIIIEITQPNIKLCRVKPEAVFNYNSTIKEECLLVSGRLDKLINKLLNKKSSRKEYLFLLVNSEEKNFLAKLKFSNKEYSLISIIYNTIEKSTYLELLDNESNYYFYTINPKIVNFKLEKSF
jgi:hypothetical protein